MSQLETALGSGRVLDLQVTLDELGALTDQVREQVLAEEEPRDAWLRALSGALSAQGQFDTRVTVEMRLGRLEEGVEAAARYVEASKSPRRFDEAARVHYAHAQVLSSLQRHRDAVATLELALGMYEQATRMRPHLVLLQAAALRMLGSYQAALDVLDTVHSASPSTPDAILSQLGVESERMQVFLALFLSDEAARCHQRGQTLLQAARKHAEIPPGALAATEITAALKEVNLRLVQGDFAGARGLADSHLEGSGAFGPTSTWRASMLFARDFARAWQEAREQKVSDDVLAALRERIAASDLPPADQVTGMLQLAWLELVHGKRDRADALLTQAEAQIDAWRADGAMDDQQRPPASEAALAWALRTRALLHSKADRGPATGDDSPQPDAELLAARQKGQASLAGLFKLHADLRPRPGGTGFTGLRHRSFVLAQMVELLLALHPGPEGVEAALEFLMGAEELGSLERTVGARAASVQEIRAALLPPKGALLVFLPGPEESHLLLLDDQPAVAYRLDPDWKLEELARDHFSAFARCTQGDLSQGVLARERALALKLRDALVPPELGARSAGWRELRVVGLEHFGEAALEALPWEKVSTLGVQVAVSRLPSLCFGIWAARQGSIAQASPQRRGVLALLSPEPAAAVLTRWDDLAALEVPAELARRVEDDFGSASRPLTGSGATAVALRAACSPGSIAALLVLGHGVQDFDRERPAALVLAGEDADDGLIFAEDLEALRAPGLVVLSTCRSARGPMRVGDSTLGNLGGACLWAGARTVILAPTDLSYEPTVALTEALFAALARGTPAAEALRQARALVASDPRWSAPWHHSALRLLGQGDLRLEPSATVSDDR